MVDGQDRLGSVRQLSKYPIAVVAKRGIDQDRLEGPEK
jgi:hypothetical protein